MTLNTLALWAGTASTVSLFAITATVAGVSKKRHAFLWAAGFAFLCLRLLAGHFASSFEPRWILELTARISSGFGALLFGWGVLLSRRIQISRWLVGLLSLAALWTAIATLLDLSPPLAVLPLELFAGGLCLWALKVNRGGPFLLNAGLSMLAFRALLRPVSYHFPIPANAALMISSFFWILPALGIVVALFSEEKSEADLERSKAGTIFTVAPSAIALTDEKGNLVHVNPTFTKLFGLKGPEVVGRNLPELLACEGFSATRRPLPGSTGEVWFVTPPSENYPAAVEAGFLGFATAFGQPAVLTDPDTGKILEINQNALDLLGVDPEHLTTSDFWSLAEPGHSVALREAVFSSAREGEVLHAVLAPRSSHSIKVELLAKKVEWRGRLLFEILLKEPSPPKESNSLESSGELAAGMAHDLKNVLQAILACSSNVGAGDDSTLRTIAEAAKKGDSMVRRILSGAKHQRMGEADLVEVVNSLRPLALKSFPPTIPLSFSLPEGKMMVKGSAEDLEQALMNLLVNAKEAVGENGRVALTLEDSPTEFILGVHDDGPGIPEGLGERIFTPLVSTKGRPGGLGLSMVRATVESVGGKVTWGKSPLYSGALFELRFPQPARGESLGILLVDGDDGFRGKADRALKLSGHRVYSTDGGERAIEILESRGDEIEVVICDLVTNGLGGKKLLTALREKSKDVRLIVASSITSDAAREGSLGLGADLFLPKPINPEELSTHLHHG